GIRDFHVTGVQTCALPISDGSLYISDSVQGRIWRIIFTGDRDNFGPTQLARMEEIKETASNIRDPDPVEDYLMRGQEAVSLGERSEERRVGKECRCRCTTG